jgi:hypothetical protein
MYDVGCLVIISARMYSGIYFVDTDDYLIIKNETMLKPEKFCVITTVYHTNDIQVS